VNIINTNVILTIKLMWLITCFIDKCVYLCLIYMLIWGSKSHVSPMGTHFRLFTSSSVRLSSTWVPMAGESSCSDLYGIPGKL